MDILLLIFILTVHPAITFVQMVMRQEVLPI